MIAFSTDTSAAAHGVYLLSFLVENYVERIISFAAQRDKKSIAALIPDNSYGAIALAQFGIEPCRPSPYTKRSGCVSGADRRGCAGWTE